jgi:hypothetical protein
MRTIARSMVERASFRVFVMVAVTSNPGSNLPVDRCPCACSMLLAYICQQHSRKPAQITDTAFAFERAYRGISGPQLDEEDPTPFVPELEQAGGDPRRRSQCWVRNRRVRYLSRGSRMTGSSQKRARSAGVLQVPINAAVSMGRCNTSSKSTCRSLRS